MNTNKGRAHRGAGLCVACAAGLGAVLAGCAGVRTSATGRQGADFARPVATYSIVARDGVTGEMGVAVQSHWFSVGPVVPWAEAGVGAVATQSLVRIDYGPRGLALMREGNEASAALRELIEADQGRDVRQVAFVDAHGRVAVHTGAKCIAEAGHKPGVAPDGAAYSAQANLMRDKGVPEAMGSAFESAPEGTPLPERLVMALHAAEKAGGDVRGKQSAAILVVKGVSTGRAWADRVVELRVEDYAAPVDELDRLLRLHRAYERMNAGDEAIEKGDVAGALREYGAAREMAGGNAEMAFWTAVSLLNAGKTGEAEPILREAYRDEKGDWRTTLRRLPRSGLLNVSDSEVERLAALR